MISKKSNLGNKHKGSNITVTSIGNKYLIMEKFVVFFALY